MSTHTLLLSSLSNAEKLSLSGEMLLRGMGTVFMVLVILWAILTVFGMVFHKGPKPVKETAPKADKPAKTEVQTAPVVQPAAQDDSALIAAITAAIIAYNTSEGKPNLPFRVVSFKRKHNAAGWMGNTADNQ